MRPEQLSERYHVLYHIAWAGSWPSIEENGLLSTKELLRLYGKSEGEIKALTRNRRDHWVEINCPGRNQAVIRDQKPMTDNGLASALPDNVNPCQWYDLINSMVFFWPTKERLKTMICAKAYKGIEHDVLIVDTKRLVQLVEPSIRLSHINSGSTYRSYPRDMTLFKSIENYPFEERWQKQRRKGAIAEVCVKDGVKQIREAVIKVKRGLAKDILKDLEI